MAIGYRIILVLLLGIWIIGNFANFLIDISPIFSIPPLVFHKAYKMVCHQNELKLICSGDNCSFLCARCSGIYLGSFIAAIVTLFINKVATPGFSLLLVAIAFTILDVVFYNVGIYSYNHWIASITGLFLGSIAFLYIRSGIENLMSELN